MAVQGPFKTPDRERSFSALVDQVVLDTGKLNALRSVVQYANLSIRECQALVLSHRDLTEDVLTSDDSPFIWTPGLDFRSLRSAYYRTQCQYPKLKLPGRQQFEVPFLYYGADDYIVFKGNISGEEIAVAYYSWLKPLIYAARVGTDTAGYPFGPYEVRSAYYDLLQNTWLYLNGAQDGYVNTLNDDSLEATRRAAAMNWIVYKWYDMIAEGAKAKIYKQFGDNERFSVSFATYKHFQEEFRRNSFEAETHENVD